MDKKQAIDLLGGSPARAAELLGVTPSAVSQWPEELPRRLADRVLGAAVRNGINVGTAVRNVDEQEPRHAA